jgi:hypothetical protein
LTLATLSAAILLSQPVLAGTSLTQYVAGSLAEQEITLANLASLPDALLAGIALLPDTAGGSDAAGGRTVVAAAGCCRHQHHHHHGR